MTGILYPAAHLLLAGRKNRIMTERSKSISTALVSTVANHELKEIAEIALQITLDRIVKEGALHDVPVVKTLVNIVKAGISVSEELFFRKLQRFLVELEKIPLNERNRLLAKYPDGSQAQTELGEQLLLVLEKLDQIQKPEILAKFFAAFVREEIDLQMFSRLSYALDRFNIDLLPNLRYRYVRDGSPVDNSEDVLHELALAGLLTVHLSTSGTLGGNAMYANNEIGRLFLKIGFGILGQ